MVIRTPKNVRWDQVNKDSIELTVLAKHFELYNLTEGKSHKTVAWYNLALKQFHGFLLESEKSTELRALREPEVREFILYLQNKTRWHTNPHVKRNDANSLQSASRPMSEHSGPSSTGFINRVTRRRIDWPL
jgi:site-specific recombinase XerD